MACWYVHRLIILQNLYDLNYSVGLHDAFSLYGRPAGYTWNPRDPQSLMFAYPVGPHKDVRRLPSPSSDEAGSLD